MNEATGSSTMKVARTTERSSFEGNIKAYTACKASESIGYTTSA